KERRTRYRRAVVGPTPEASAPDVIIPMINEVVSMGRKGLPTPTTTNRSLRTGGISLMKIGMEMPCRRRNTPHKVGEMADPRMMCSVKPKAAGARILIGKEKAEIS